MRRYRNILVGVDGSEPSVHALKEAMGLARWGRGGVTVIHVTLFYDGDLNLLGVRNIKEAVQGLSGQILSEAADIADSYGIPIRTILDAGKAHERIAHHATVRDVDLIVLGSRRSSSIARLFSGKVLAGVLDRSIKDVMAIPHKTSIRWESILFAFQNFSCSRDTAARIIELAAVYGGELRTLSVMNSFFGSNGKDPSNREYILKNSSIECLANVHAFADQAGIKNEWALLSGRFHKVVGKYAGKEHIGVIILKPDEAMRLKWGLAKSPIESIVTSAPCPVLFLKYY